MEAKASKHASKREHACECARASVCVRARARARARSLMATLPGGGPAEDGSELRSHACGVAKVETRGRAPGVGRIVIYEGRVFKRTGHKIMSPGKTGRGGRGVQEGY